MQKDIKAVVITPEKYPDNKNYPVLYLLHGYSGNYANWGSTDEVKKIADSYEMIVVCPDGAYGSWYFDSPVDNTFKYETYISKELIKWIDGNYRTIASREGRAISRLSMGGHGALDLAFRHQNVFGACGSMSGGVDIRPFPNKWDLAKRLGRLRDFPERWKQHSVMGLLHLLTSDLPEIIIDCGTEDFFYEVNEKLHRELLRRDIPHDYISRSGAHNREYWRNAVMYQALFFNTYFQAKKRHGISACR